MNYYELLGINENATEEEIKRAYKIQMKKWHPDINKSEDAISMSMKINEAKETLLNERKRKEYDEFINQKEEKTYQKYSYNTNTTTTKQSTKESTKTKTKSEPKKESKQETKMVTKWEYLKDYLKFSNVSLFRKIIAVIFVLLESFLCFILKYLVIGLAFICFILSNTILIVYSYVYWFIFIYLGLIVFIWAQNGLDVLMHEHFNKIIGLIIILLVYISAYLLPIIGNKLLSPKVFNFLYNKLDIYLFKKAVGYK